MTRIRQAAAAVGLVALLALSGCGNNAEPTSAAPKDAGSSSKAETSYPTQRKAACDILTPKVAKSLLGSVADASAPIPDTKAAGVTISSCVRASSVADLEKAGSVSLLMRVAQSPAGADANQAGFATEAMPQGAQPVTGYGEKAFWNPGLGQLNILENGNWYVLASGPIDPRKHTLAATEKLADAVIDQL